ncbi:MAG: GreA/GreB family elongation factor [Verrucomicrobiota bacterium]
MQTDTDLQQIMESDQIPAGVAKGLEELKPGKCCSHRSWGLGQVTQWKGDTGHIIIDFQDKPGHVMEFEYAVASLKPLSDDHIEAKLVVALDEVKKQAQDDVVSLMRTVVTSLGKSATAERIEATLVPVVMIKDEWRKWWDSAKRAMKKDSHFVVPSKRTEAIAVHDEPPCVKSRLVTIFENAKGVKAKANALETISKNWKDVEDQEFVDSAMLETKQLLKKVPRSQVATAVELALAREELIDAAGREHEVDEASMTAFLPKEARHLVALLEKLPAAKQGRILERSRKLLGDQWQEMYLELLPHASAKMAQAIYDAFDDEGRAEEFLFTVQRLIRERNLSPEFMLFIARNRKKAAFEKLIDAQFVLAILSALEFDQMGGIKRATKLGDLLLTDKEALKDLLSKSSDEEVRDITRSILLSPAFEELDKRSLLAALVKLYPFVQGMIVGSVDDDKSEAVTVIVSWESLRTRQQELEEIVNHKIPQNSREIGIARSYGDLRENAEFKAAKEMQTVLMRRKAELEIMLANAQGTDFKNVDTSEVGPGTKVTLSVNETGGKEIYNIMGAWDSDPVKGIISYMTPVARALVKRKVGDEVEVPDEADGSTRKVTIEAIASLD